MCVHGKWVCVVCCSLSLPSHHHPFIHFHSFFFSEAFFPTWYYHSKRVIIYFSLSWWSMYDEYAVCVKAVQFFYIKILPRPQPFHYSNTTTNTLILSTCVAITCIRFSRKPGGQGNKKYGCIILYIESPSFFIQKAEFFPALYSCLPTYLKVYTLLLCSVKLKSQWHAKEQTNINQIKASPKNNQPFTLLFSWFTKFILVNPENKKGLCYFYNIHIPSIYLTDLWVLYVVIIHH